MSRLISRAFVAATLTVVALAGPVVVGQAPPAGAADAGQGAIVGTGTFTSFVENMDRSLAFYHDVFGMEVPEMPASGSRPYNNFNPRLFAMFDIPGARERHQSARVPGTRVNVELMEVQQVEHRTIPLRIQDPGAATLVLIVRDVEATLARVKQANAPIVTPGGMPVAFPDGTRAIMIRDIDNRFVELRQPAPGATAGAPAGDIADMRLSIAVNDLDQTTRVYRDVLGFTVEADRGFSADAALQKLTGLSSAQVRRGRMQAPGSQLWIELIEFKGVDRTPLRMRIQDRGAARLQLRAQNVDAVVARMKAAGLKVVSEGGGAVPIPPNLKGALVADPNNFFLTPFAPCDGCAPRTPAPGQTAAVQSADTIVSEAVVAAPVQSVWEAFTTKAGMESWMVGTGDIEPRVGGHMRTSYRKGADLDGDSAIHHEIVSIEPGRLLSYRTVKSPKDFPFAATIGQTRTVVALEPLDAGRTKVTVTMLGYSSDPESQKMRGLFEKGNAATLAALVKKFAAAR